MMLRFTGRAWVSAFSLSLTAALAAAPSVARAEPAPAKAEAGEPIAKVAAPTRFVADLSLDVGANTYTYQQKQTALSLELSPRFGVLLADFLDIGLNFIAGYGGPTKTWSQATMFGVGPYAGSKLPLSSNWRLIPWVAVLYHQSFLAGFTPGPNTSTQVTDDVSGVRQIIRIDAHLDAVFHPASRTGFLLGGFVKNRVASFDAGLGRAHEIDAGLRIGAVSYF